MRKAINENPVAQIAVIGLLVLAAGLLLLTRLGGGGESADTAPPPEPSASSAATSQAAPESGSAVSSDSAAGGGSVTSGAAPASGAPAGGPSVSSGTATAQGATGTVTPEALVPGPGLPAKFKSAWDSGDAIVLLIVRGGATEDRLVRRSVEALSAPGLSVFVARAQQIARYSRITQSVGVNRVPALVVVRPKAVSGSAPQATVSYGFRSLQSVLQAVQDALYSGRDDLPYSPN